MDNIGRRRSLKEILPKKDGPVVNNGSTLTQIAIDQANSQDPVGMMGKNKREFTMNRGRFNPKLLIGGIVLVVVILGIVIFSTSFAQATISLLPKQARVNLTDRAFTADRNSNGTNIEFGLVSNEIIASEKVTATGTETVKKKAEGTITIYNEFSDKPEKLIAQTRFESPDGKIYRISQAVSVPGSKTEAGKVIPGSLDVKVVADKEGEDYNIGLVDFTIPGLKGDARFEKLYAKSKTAMTGGFVGEVKKVSAEDEKQARAKLRTELEGRQKELNQPQIPEGFILFDDAVFHSFVEGGIESTGEGVTANDALVVEKLVFTGILFNKAELSQFLADRFIPDYDDEPVSVSDFKDLNFKLEGKDKITDPASLSEINFTLDGSPLIVWDIDIPALKKAVGGLSGNELTDAIGAFPAIARSNVSFRPFWIKTVPKNEVKIKIEYQNNE